MIETAFCRSGVPVSISFVVFPFYHPKMKLFTNFEDESSFRKGIVTVGNFDGVHLGHQSMIATLKNQAEKLGVPAVVFTFDPPPLFVLESDYIPQRLTTLEQKAALLEKYGVDVVIAYPTDRSLLDLSPSEFFEQLVLGNLEARGLVEGPNFRFGKNRQGDLDLLTQMCNEAEVGLSIVPQFNLDDRMVSSSAIREHIGKDRFGSAIEMLGHPYRVSGKVTTGSQRGTQLGYPTANLTEIATMIPADGVYAGLTTLSDVSFVAAVNIGSSPTFEDDARKFELHLLDFEGDLYGETVSVDLYEKIRDVENFNSPDQLQEQLAQDVNRIRRYFQEKNLLQT